MKVSQHLFLISLSLFVALGLRAQDPGIMESPLQRVIILTDVENEPDDSESLVRLMLYSNDLDIRGIVPSTSTHMRNRVAPETVFGIIDAYEKVLPNLRLHRSDYPSAESLRSVVKCGLPRYGMNAVGDGKDSEGSELIISELKRDDARPLWVCAWGGVNPLAQSLYKLRASESKSSLKRLLAKLRVYTISDQDDSGEWIRNNFPDIFYIVSPGPYNNATWPGISQVAEGADNYVISDEWLAENIQQGHGPLGVCYPDVAYTMEGDTPSYLGLIRNGLNNMEHPNWGGWGGRYELYLPEYNNGQGDGAGVPYNPETRPIWTKAEDTILGYLSGVGPKVKGRPQSIKTMEATIWRWRVEYQNDFAARMDWCVKPYSEANHNPVAVVNMYSKNQDYTVDTPERALIPDFTVKSGEGFWLDATGSYDPDGDNLSFFWFNYPEAGDCEQFVPVGGSPVVNNARFIAPKVLKPSYLHFILKVTDKSTPRLTTYKRIIVRVLP